MRTIVSAAAALCLAAACGGDDADPGNATEEVGPSGAATGDQTPESLNQPAPNATNVPGPEQAMAAGNLSPVNNSGVTGSVNVRGIDQRTEISLNVTGVTAANRRLQAAVVQGSCEQPGGEAAAIGPIPVGAGNIAAMTDTVPLPAGTVLDGRHALVVKGQNAGPATPPLACTPLPQWQPTTPQ